MKKNKKYILLTLLMVTIVVLASLFIYEKSKDFISLISSNSNYFYSSSKETSSSANLNEKYENIIYKTADNRDLKLDIYTPINKKYKKSPVLIYIHGGAWQWGDKTIDDNYKSFINSILEDGYTVIAIDYSLINSKVKFPTPVEDCKDAIRWVNNHGSEYNLDTNNIGLFGISSGAHLALLSAYSDDVDFIGDDNLKSFSSKVKYVIAVAPPVVLDSSINRNDYVYIENFLGDTAASNGFNEKIKESSPISYVKKGIPNTLVIHGKEDTFVPFNQSISLIDKIESVGAKGEMITLENGNHDLSSSTPIELLKMISGIKSFISKNTKI